MATGHRRLMVIIMEQINAYICFDWTELNVAENAWV